MWHPPTSGMWFVIPSKEYWPQQNYTKMRPNHLNDSCPGQALQHCNQMLGPWWIAGPTLTDKNKSQNRVTRRERKNVWCERDNVMLSMARHRVLHAFVACHQELRTIKNPSFLLLIQYSVCSVQSFHLPSKLHCIWRQAALTKVQGTG